MPIVTMKMSLISQIQGICFVQRLNMLSELSAVFHSVIMDLCASHRTFEFKVHSKVVFPLKRVLIEMSIVWIEIIVFFPNSLSMIFFYISSSG